LPHARWWIWLRKKEKSLDCLRDTREAARKPRVLADAKKYPSFKPKLSGIVENQNLEDAPSTASVVGRYSPDAVLTLLMASPLFVLKQGGRGFGSVNLTHAADRPNWAIEGNRKASA
jgi:hypothetical protein